MNQCSSRLSAGQLEAVSSQCASVRRHHRHLSPDTETIVALALVRTPSGINGTPVNPVRFMAGTWCSWHIENLIS